MHFKVLRSDQDFKFNVFPIKKTKSCEFSANGCLLTSSGRSCLWPNMNPPSSAINTQLMSLKVVFFSEPTNLSAAVSKRHAGLPKPDFTPKQKLGSTLIRPLTKAEHSKQAVNLEKNRIALESEFTQVKMLCALRAVCFLCMVYPSRPI